MGRTPVQGPPLLGRQPGAMPPEPGRRLQGVGTQRQFRPRRQLINPTPPVITVPLITGAFTRGPRSQHIIPKRRRLSTDPASIRTQRTRPGPQLPQLTKQHPNTAVVANQQIDRDVQKQSAGGTGGTQLEQRPLIGRPHLMGHLRTDLVDDPPRPLPIRLPRIRTTYRIARHLGQDPLIPIGRNHRAQHVMPPDQEVPSILQPPLVPVRQRQFQIPVTGHAPVVERLTAPEQIRRLDIGQRKRLIPGRRVHHQPRPELLGPQIRQYGLLAVLQLPQPLLGEDSLRGPVPQLAVLLVERDTQCGEPVHVLAGIHTAAPPAPFVPRPGTDVRRTPSVAAPAGENLDAGAGLGRCARIVSGRWFPRCQALSDPAPADARRPP